MKLLDSAHNKTQKFLGIAEIMENEKYAQNTCDFLDLLVTFDSLEYFEIFFYFMG